MSDYDERRAKEREDQRRYEGDVFYEVWRAGGNPDRINDDRVSDRYYNGDSSEQAARSELSHQRRARERQQEEEYFDEQFPEQQEDPGPQP